MKVSLSVMEDYEYLDSGAGERLERFGPLTVIRPAPMALWERGLDESHWQRASLLCSRSTQNGGRWVGEEQIPDPWTTSFSSFRLKLMPSENGQIGIFPEQKANWSWVCDLLQRQKRPCRVLNGFAYTGAMTLAAAAAGDHVEVCHLEGARSSINQAKENASLSGLSSRKIRWILDDVLSFMHREVKRGQRYDALILDPPAFGRGPEGETWKFERDFDELLTLTAALLSEAPLFVILSCHIPEWMPRDLAARLSTLPRLTDAVEAFPLTLTSAQGGHELPLGIVGRCKAV